MRTEINVMLLDTYRNKMRSNLIKKIAFGAAILVGLAGTVDANEDKKAISVYGESGIWDSEITAMFQSYHNACIKAKGIAGQKDWFANREFNLKKGKVCLIPPIYSKYKITRLGNGYLATAYVEYDKKDVIDKINSDLWIEEHTRK